MTEMPSCGTMRGMWPFKPTQQSEPDDRAYLSPYARAARKSPGAFSSLLWASPQSQHLRFDAIARIADLGGRSLLDVGCGRADLAVYLELRGINLSEYIGIEAIDATAAAAEQRGREFGCDSFRIIRGDVVADPRLMFTGSDVIVVSGSFNTFDRETFYSVLSRACDAAAEALVFNFLSSPDLAAARYLTWHRPTDVEAFVQKRGRRFEVLCDYLDGDCTMAVWK